MYRLVYLINENVKKKYFDDFSDLYYFCNLGLILNNSFIVIRIFDMKNNEVFYEN